MSFASVLADLFDEIDAALDPQYRAAVASESWNLGGLLTFFDKRLCCGYVRRIRVEPCF